MDQSHTGGCITKQRSFRKSIGLREHLLVNLYILVHEAIVQMPVNVKTEKITRKKIPEEGRSKVIGLVKFTTHKA